MLAIVTSSGHHRYITDSVRFDAMQNAPRFAKRHFDDFAMSCCSRGIPASVGSTPIKQFKFHHSYLQLEQLFDLFSLIF